MKIYSCFPKEASLNQLGTRIPTLQSPKEQREAKPHRNYILSDVCFLSALKAFR